MPKPNPKQRRSQPSFLNQPRISMIIELAPPQARAFEALKQGCHPQYASLITQQQRIAQGLIPQEPTHNFLVGAYQLSYEGMRSALIGEGKQAIALSAAMAVSIGILTAYSISDELFFAAQPLKCRMEALGYLSQKNEGVRHNLLLHSLDSFSHSGPVLVKMAAAIFKSIGFWSDDKPLNTLAHG